MLEEKYFRAVLITADSKSLLEDSIKKIKKWRYDDKVEAASHLPFSLINEEIGYIITFKKMNDLVYISLNISRFADGEPQIPEVLDRVSIYDDVLLKLCIDIRENGELCCGIIPDSKDTFKGNY